MGHVDLNRHLTLMKVRSDPTCPLCQDEEETALHLFGICRPLQLLNLLGLYRMDYTELGNVGRYPEACQSFQEISLASGLSGKRNGPTWWPQRWMVCLRVTSTPKVR